tara:strand:- start:65 stop:466 length:402 start_codon:yes stop_codon:yes gene_type:complete
MAKYVVSLALQVINGSIMAAFILSPSGSILVAAIAGTLHPSPIKRGKKVLPDKPSLLKNLSIINADRAEKPDSSIHLKKKYNSNNGKKKSPNNWTPTPNPTKHLVYLIYMSHVKVSDHFIDGFSKTTLLRLFK